jgi:hypothetical protein
MGHTAQCTVSMAPPGTCQRRLWASACTYTGTNTSDTATSTRPQLKQQEAASGRVAESLAPTRKRTRLSCGCGAQVEGNLPGPGQSYQSSAWWKTPSSTLGPLQREGSQPPPSVAACQGSNIQSGCRQRDPTYTITQLNGSSEEHRAEPHTVQRILRCSE